MKQGLTEIVVLLDKSGSMSGYRSAGVSGYNEFLNTQKALPGEARFTLVMFDTEVVKKVSSMNIRDVPEMKLDDYQPAGNTALYDAVARTIDEVGKRLAATPEDERPEKVIFVITTDGEENSSQEFAQKDVFNRITVQRDTYRWNFLFLAANQDAFASGGALGINHCLNFSGSNAGVRGMNMAYNCYAKSIRSGQTADAAYMTSSDVLNSADPSVMSINAKGSANGQSKNS